MSRRLMLKDLDPADVQKSVTLPEVAGASAEGSDLGVRDLLQMAQVRVSSLRGVLSLVETSEDPDLCTRTRNAVSAAGYLADEVSGLLELLHSAVGAIESGKWGAA